MRAPSLAFNTGMTPASFGHCRCICHRRRRHPGGIADDRALSFTPRLMTLLRDVAPALYLRDATTAILFIYARAID